MNKIEKLLAELKRKNKKALAVFLTSGYPDIKSTKKNILLIEKYVDIIELGIPFSDPIADGPAIQYSSHQALKKNINLKKIFAIVKDIRKKTDLPVILMGYMNPIYRFGLKNFFQKASAAGVDGLIVPDLPCEESSSILKLAKNYNIASIPLVALTTPPDRAKRIAAVSTGFVYITAVTGITGARKNLSGDLIPYLKMMRGKTKKPLFVGFGISKAEHLKKLKSYCDGFIVGSAVTGLIRRKVAIKNFIKNLSSHL